MYNQERVRDFRYGRHKSNEAEELLLEDIERTGKVSYSSFYTDPIPYLRDYQYHVFQESSKLIHKKFRSFETIRVLDFTGSSHFPPLFESDRTEKPT